MALLIAVLLLLVLWWASKRTEATHHETGPTPDASPPRSTDVPEPASARPTRRNAQRPRAADGPLTEDDVIVFGLALERSEDVVRSAIRDPVRAPREPRLRREAPGPS